MSTKNVRLEEVKAKDGAKAIWDTPVVKITNLKDAQMFLNGFGPDMAIYS